MKRDIGGNRLGSGGKMEVHMHGFNRSNHDIGNTWRSTMSAGTLVPFLNRVALPGDDFDIELNCDVMTHPTIGPLFGSYKVQLDIFQTPVRLYQGKLHQNKLNIGLNMANIKLPQVKLKSDMPNEYENVDNSQINPSCIFSYLGVRGLGINYDATVTEVKRQVNGIAYLNYFDIGKNYYCNKQEENAYIIHNDFGKILTNFLNGQINTNHSDLS